MFQEVYVVVGDVGRVVLYTVYVPCLKSSLFVNV